MRITLPSVLHSYTRGVRIVDAAGATLGAVLVNLDARYPGIRFRMVNEADALRPHIRVFVNNEQVDRLDCPVSDVDEIVILQALSGG